MHNEIQILGLSFLCNQPLSIAEGRKLLIQAVETLLQEINQDTRIHPYLIRHPFRPRNVEISIVLVNPDGTNVAPGALEVLLASEGSLQYKINDPTGDKLLTVYKETYEEALARLKEPP